MAKGQVERKCYCYLCGEQVEGNIHKDKQLICPQCVLDIVSCKEPSLKGKIWIGRLDLVESDNDASIREKFSEWRDEMKTCQRCLEKGKENNRKYKEFCPMVDYCKSVPVKEEETKLPKEDTNGDTARKPRKFRPTMDRKRPMHKV